MAFLARLLSGLYVCKSPRLRRMLLRLITRLEGGDMYSETARKICSKYHDIEIGKYSYGCFKPSNIWPHTKIGRYCSFSADVYIYNANHPLQYKSTHPFFYNPVMEKVARDLLSRRTIEIGNDVWVGQNVIILASVDIIGDGAVIGAGAVVTKNVPDFAVVVGNPGKVIKY